MNSQSRATKKYEQKNYDRVVFMVHKGNKDIIKAKAAEQGKSLNQFIIDTLKREIPDLY